MAAMLAQVQFVNLIGSGVMRLPASTQEFAKGMDWANLRFYSNSTFSKTVSGSGARRLLQRASRRLLDDFEWEEQVCTDPGCHTAPSSWYPSCVRRDGPPAQ